MTANLPRIIYWAKMQLARKETTEALAQVDGIDVHITTTLQETLDAIPGAIGLVLAHGPQDEGKQVLNALRVESNTVRWLHFITAGREGYEELGWPKGVCVTYAGGGVSPAVAEHAMALLLALGRRVPDLVTTVMPRRAFDRTLVAPRARSLEGSTVLLVGYGHIGREFARRVHPFGVRILTVSRSAQRDELLEEALPLSALHQALARADAIVVAIAHTPETTGLLSDAAFDACRKGALLVNVARGAVVDTEALCRALADGRIGGAALDVTEPEPLPPNHPLWDSPNLLISPHFAASGSPCSLQRLGEGVAQNARRLLSGETLLHAISA